MVTKLNNQAPLIGQEGANMGALITMLQQVESEWVTIWKNIL